MKLDILAVNGNERLGLILFSLAPSFLISALSLLVSPKQQVKLLLVGTLPLGAAMMKWDLD